MGLAAASASTTTKLPMPLPSKDTVKAPAKTIEKQWNTKNLGGRLAVDLASALCAASMVAPVISIIDRYASVSQVTVMQFRNFI